MTDNNGADSDPVTVAVTVIAAPVISIPDGLTASVNADGNGGTAGTLTVVNLPAPDAAVAFTSLERVADSGGYGFFTLDAEGGWEYELDNSAGSAYQKLSDTDAPVMVQFPVTATVAGFADALSATLTITVTGRDDPPVAVVMINGVIGTGGSISVAQGAMVTLERQRQQRPGQRPDDLPVPVDADRRPDHHAHPRRHRRHGSRHERRPAPHLHHPAGAHAPGVHAGGNRGGRHRHGNVHRPSDEPRHL